MWSRRIPVCWVMVVFVLGGLVVWRATTKTAVDARQLFTPAADRACQGTLYCRQTIEGEDRFWAVSADGSETVRLPDGVAGEPSWWCHAGQRWFLTVRGVTDGTYADGREQTAVFAVREDGRSVRLTDRADIEPIPDTCRWPQHGHDRLISWVGRRWEVGGQVAEGGIYVAEVRYDESGNIVGLMEQPESPRLSVALTAVGMAGDGNGPPTPDIQVYDWSPHDAMIVAVFGDGRPHVIDLATGAVQQVLGERVINAAWSPDGRRIAVKVQDGGIVLVSPAGAGPTPVLMRSPSLWCGFACPVWSPTGKHLAYQQLWFDTDPLELPGRTDACYVCVSSGARSNLTANLPGVLTPLAWR